MNQLNPRIRLALGDWREKLAGAGDVHSVITDGPFGRRTHEGQEHGRYDGAEGMSLEDDPLPYAHWSPADVIDFVSDWAPRTHNWMVCLTSHDLVPAYEQAYDAVGFVGFAPIPCVVRGSNVRLQGDGPSSWTCYAMVARRRGIKWRTLRGAYVGPREKLWVRGGKPLWLMQELVGDYSNEGDLVCDPLAGGGTTLVAASLLKRFAIGSELDATTHAKAVRRIARGCLPTFDVSANG